MMLRRETLAALDSCYRFVEELVQAGVGLPWRARAFDELLMLVIMAPVMSWNIRAQHRGRLWASDASLDRAGAVYADVPKNLLEEMCRYVDLKGNARVTLP